MSIKFQVLCVNQDSKVYFYSTDYFRIIYSIYMVFKFGVGDLYQYFLCPAMEYLTGENAAALQGNLVYVYFWRLDSYCGHCQS